MQWHNGTTSETRMITLLDWYTGETFTFISKLWGYSYGAHQHNSARLGIKLFPDYVRLVTYVYDSGVRLKEQKIIDLPYGSAFVSGIDFKQGSWVFKVDQKETGVKVTSRPEFGYFLFPYFGGRVTAPKDIKTEILNI